MFAEIFALVLLLPPGPGATCAPESLPSRETTRIPGSLLPRTGESTPAPRKRFFGVGIAFQAKGGAQGIALEQVVPGSPADHAGLSVGTVIVEIDGQTTVGRTGEDCTRMVRESGHDVSLQYFDPLTFTLRTRTLQKEWFPLPN